MATSGKLLGVVCLSVLLFGAVIIYKLRQDEDATVCQRTLSSRLFEALFRFVYGLSCEMSDKDFNGSSLDVISGIWALVKKIYGSLISRSPVREELYHCSLKWGKLLHVEFSMQAYQCSRKEELGDDWLVDWYSKLPLLVLGGVVLGSFVVDYHIRKQMRGLVLIDVTEEVTKVKSEETSDRKDENLS